jgi:hypothetical protein
MTLTDFNNRYSYKFDSKGRDQWRVLKPNALDQYHGDCEDYSLSVLYYVICKESWLKFWWLLITFQAKLCYVVTKKDGGHAVLRYGDQYIDNWTKEWVTKSGMEKVGHEFHPWRFIPTTVAIKMVMAKLRG